MRSHAANWSSVIRFRWRIASVARLPWRWHSTTEHDQRQIRLPLQPLTRLNISNRAARSRRPDLVLEGQVHAAAMHVPRATSPRTQPSDFAWKSCYEVPRTIARNRMTHHDEGAFFPRRLQPPMEIVYDLITDCSATGAFVALAMTGVINNCTPARIPRRQAGPSPSPWRYSHLPE